MSPRRQTPCRKADGDRVALPRARARVRVERQPRLVPRYGVAQCPAAAVAHGERPPGRTRALIRGCRHGIRTHLYGRREGAGVPVHLELADPREVVYSGVRDMQPHVAQRLRGLIEPPRAVLAKHVLDDGLVRPRPRERRRRLYRKTLRVVARLLAAGACVMHDVAVDDLVRADVKRQPVRRRRSLARPLAARADEPVPRLGSRAVRVEARVNRCLFRRQRQVQPARRSINHPRRRTPPVSLRDCRLKVRLHAVEKAPSERPLAFAGHLPAKHRNAPDLLSARVVPVIDLAVDGAHPSVRAVAPRPPGRRVVRAFDVLVAFGDVNRLAPERQRQRAQVVPVDPEVVEDVLVRRPHLCVARCQRGIAAVRVRVHRQPVHLCRPDAVQDVDPVVQKAGYALCGVGRRPRAGWRRHDLRSRSRRLDGAVALVVAAHITRRGDRLACRGVAVHIARPFAREVRFVSDDPVVAPLRVRHVVRAALGERGVVGLIRQRAVRTVAVVEANDDPVALIRPVPVVAAGGVRGVVPDAFGEHDPPLGRRHEALSAGVMNAVDVLRLRSPRARRAQSQKSSNCQKERKFHASIIRRCGAGYERCWRRGAKRPQKAMRWRRMYTPITRPRAVIVASRLLGP